MNGHWASNDCSNMLLKSGAIIIEDNPSQWQSEDFLGGRTIRFNIVYMVKKRSSLCFRTILFVIL